MKMPHSIRSSNSRQSLASSSPSKKANSLNGYSDVRSSGAAYGSSRPSSSSKSKGKHAQSRHTKGNLQSIKDIDYDFLGFPNLWEKPLDAGIGVDPSSSQLPAHLILYMREFGDRIDNMIFGLNSEREHPSFPGVAAGIYETEEGYQPRLATNGGEFEDLRGFSYPMARSLGYRETHRLLRR
jgi:hypothetical protein